MTIMRKKNTKKKRINLPGILAAAAIGIIEFLDVFLLYRKIRNGEVISVRLSSGEPAAFLLQCLREFLFPAVLLILFALVLKRDFLSSMYMTLKGKWQRITAAILVTGILGFTAYGLALKPDKVSILLSLFYYFVIVAFAEEFVIRDACTYFLRDVSWPLRYLLPNLFFALPHLFNYAGWGEISGEVLLTFLFRGLLGYIFSGCLLQLLKEKSGSIWLPVLLHCLMDYSVILKY
jgi:membrane protease YdiL (CAAX protease family)